MLAHLKEVVVELAVEVVVLLPDVGHLLLEVVHEVQCLRSHPLPLLR